MKTWYLYTILVVVTWGIWGVFSKLASQHSPPRQALLFQTAGYLVVGLLVLMIEGFRIQWSAPGFTWALLGGFAASAGFLAFFSALTDGKAATVVTMSALYPVVTIAISLAFLHERLNLRQGIGIIFALVACALLAS